MIAELQRITGENGFDLSPGMLRDFAQYAQLLDEWNQKMNLTAITEPHEVAAKHFLDSLLLLKAVEIPQNASLIDVGTGAGFPGVPVKIARPDLAVTLLDSLNKRIGFLTALSAALGQHNTMIHGRAEELGQHPSHREQYFLATARAVAPLWVLCEYCLPFVRVGGVFAALKGGAVEREADQAASALVCLGGGLEEIRGFTLPDGSARSIVVIRKRSQTPPKYPRSFAKITKTPL